MSDPKPSPEFKDLQAKLADLEKTAPGAGTKQTTITVSGPANKGKVPAQRAAAAFLLERGMGVTVPEGTPAASLLSRHLDLSAVKIAVVACSPDPGTTAKIESGWNPTVKLEITGPTGSGKTRIANTLAAFYRTRGADVRMYDEGMNVSHCIRFRDDSVKDQLSDLSTVFILKEQQ